MSNLEILKHDETGSILSRRRDKQQLVRHILVCIDTADSAQAMLAHAAAVASATEARITVMRVLENASGKGPTDPVEWMLHHREVETSLRDCASRLGGYETETAVVDGPVADRICAFARDNAVDLTVLGGGRAGSRPFGGLGGTARRVAEGVDGSVLIVPSGDVGSATVHYKKVMMPLDGSSRSECALPLGLAIAAAHDAVIVLVHAAPNVDVTAAGPPDAETTALRDRLRLRNERAAEQYLRQTRSRLPQIPAAKIRVLPSGDPRHALAQAAVEETAALVVLSPTGQGGHPDMPLGSVAEYLINHLNIPVLLARSRNGHWGIAQYSNPADTSAGRLPGRALM